MVDLLNDFRSRRALITNMNFEEASSRLSGLISWLDTNETTSAILLSLNNDARVSELLGNKKARKPPAVSSPEDLVLLGLYFIRNASSEKELYNLALKYDIHPSYQTTSAQDLSDEVVNRYINPALDYIEARLIEAIENDKPLGFRVSQDISSTTYPLEISQSLQGFLRDHSNARQTAFIMMRFGMTEAHTEIVKVIKDVLSKYEIVAMRADDKEYHDDLFSNVLTYIYGCNFGIAVFERLETDDFNPNVALEVGYMRALKKPVCLLKDKTI